MAVNVLRKMTGGVDEPVIFINNRLTQPRGPSRELNAAAVTTVGRINGSMVSMRIKRFPVKSKRENT